MYRSYSMVALLLIFSCRPVLKPQDHLKAPPELAHNKTALTENLPSQLPDPPEGVVITPKVGIETAADIPVMIVPPAPGFFPIYTGGGGGGRRPRLPCENGTSDCNDKNPCSIDTCENDTCVHALDTSKEQFGSCEIDGHSCTLGKCIVDAGQIQCFEQRREYIAGELGCQDDNVCTADSCIEIPANIHEKTTPDGNVIPNNQHQCVQEVTNGLLCATQGCQSGFCQQTGTGMSPEDPFVVSCVVDETAPINCPATDNPCTINVCDAEDGCVEENLPVETPCEDGSVCTTGDECNGAGVCIGTPVDPQIACGTSPDTCRAFGCDDMLGCVLTEPANEGQACSNGDPCVMTEICTEGVCGGGTAVVCPDDNNVCTNDTCKAGTGCIYPPSTATECDDLNNCTNNDTCTNGACLGTILDCSIEDNPCQVGFCDVTVAAGCSTVDFTGPYGESCITPFLGVCSVGAIMCLEGALTNPPMCEPLVRPGDKVAACNNTTDDDCDGDAYECDCPQAVGISIKRYVDPAGSNAGANNCTDSTNPCQTIAYAITQSLPNDTLLLSGSTFLETNIVVDRNVYIEGYGPAVTIVQANGTNRVFTINSGVNAFICGLNITGGGVIAGNGGGLLNNGTTTISSSAVSGNTASVGAGIANSRDSIMTITASSISNNIAIRGGGGIYNDYNVTLNVKDSTIDSNSIIPDAFGGGGIFSESGPGSITIDGSTISNNSTRGTGGGISNNSTTTLNITNSTISGNSTTSVGGGIRNFGTATIANTTITRNQATFGGGGISNGGVGPISFSHTIIANQISGGDCAGGVIDSGFNLDSDDSCGTFTWVPGFILPPLANNGGPTQTHALDPSGTSVSAIDSGNTTCGVTTDQRGEQRPVNYFGVPPTRCDIGAFEIQP